MVLSIFEVGFGEIQNSPNFDAIYGGICAGCWLVTHLYFGLRVWFVLQTRKQSTEGRITVEASFRKTRVKQYNDKIKTAGVSMMAGMTFLKSRSSVTRLGDATESTGSAQPSTGSSRCSNQSKRASNLISPRPSAVLEDAGQETETGAVLNSQI